MSSSMPSERPLPIRESKYIRHFKIFEEYPILKTIADIIEHIRWTLNRILLFRPFYCCAKCDCNACYPHCSLKPCECKCRTHYLNQYFYLITIGEIIFWIIMIGSIGVSVPLMLGGRSSGEAIGSLSGIFFMVSWFLGQRNTLWNILFGLSFERGIIFHKYIARIAIILAIMHGYVYLDDPGLFDGNSLSGTIATFIAIGIGITSIDFIRRHLFNFFLTFHWILFIGFVVFCVIHGAGMVVVGFGLSVLDWIIRIYYNYFQKVEIKSLQILNANVIRLEFDKKEFMYEAGQYVFICIPAISFWEWHPFSLSSYPNDDEIMIHIRVLGNWTKKLHKLVSKNNPPGGDWTNLQCYIEGPYGNINIPLNKYEHIVLISGGIGITPMQSIFNQLIYNIQNQYNNNNNNNSQNININVKEHQTPGRNISRINSGLEFSTRIKRIHFIWSVRDPTMFHEFSKRHTHWSSINYISPNKNDQIDIEPNIIHVNNNKDDEQLPMIHLNVNNKSKSKIKRQHSHTNISDNRLPKYFVPDLLMLDIDQRAPSFHDDDGRTIINGVEIITHFYLTRIKNKEKQNEFLKKYSFVKFGRPKIEQILKNARNRANDIETGKSQNYNIKNGYGVGVLACGPLAMLDDVKKYSSRHKVDCHTEIFDF